MSLIKMSRPAPAGQLFLSVFTIVAMVAMPAMSALAAQSSGSTEVSLGQASYLSDQQLDPGSYKVRWKSQSPEATVVFSQRGKDLAEVKARLVEREKKARYSSVVTRKDDDGREVILEIRIQGKRQVLVLDPKS